MKWTLAALLWAGTVVVAYLLGNRIDLDPEPPSAVDGTRSEAEQELARLRQVHEELLRRHEETVARVGSRETVPPPEVEVGSGAHAVAPAAAPDEPPEMDGPLPSLAGIASAEEAAQLLMGFLDTQLARGPRGYDAILRALGAIEKNEDLARLFQDETQATRVIYPLVRFLVEREEQALDMSEYVFRTMAEDPAALAKLGSNESLEVFTEGIGFLLPGAVDEERLARFRGYAEAVLATPEGSLPPAVEKRRSELRRLVERFWSTPLTTDEALSKLAENGLDAAQASRLLASIPAERLGEVDVTGILAPMLRSGDYRAIRALENLPATVTLDLPRLDGEVLRGLAAGQTNAWIAVRYLAGTGRDEWTKVRPFVEQTLAGDEQLRTAGGQLLANLPGNARPDKAYVEETLRRYEWSEGMRATLRNAYQIR